MKKFISVIALAALFLSAGCAKKMPSSGYRLEAPQLAATLHALSDTGAVPSPETGSVGTTIPVAQDRMLIWTAQQRVEVEVVTNAVNMAVEITKNAGGYVQSSSVDSDSDAELTIRLPSAKLHGSLSSFAALGSNISVSVSSTDATEEFVDTQARAKVAKQLRDRLQELVTKATNVTEVLQVERELARVQAEIEAMEARIKSLSKQADLATIQLHLTRRSEPVPSRIYGPLGLAWYGLTWFIEKLFIIR